MAIAHPSPGRHRVPAEHRLLGMGRRTFPLAIVALVVWAIWTLVLPWINQAVPWNDPVRPGDVIQVTPTVTMTQTVGWALQSGLRADQKTVSGSIPDSVVLAQDGVLLQITNGPWTGDVTQLLQQITRITTTVSGGPTFHVNGEGTTITARTGETGVLETFSSPRAEGVLAAYVFDGTGIQIQAVGPPQQLAAHADDLSAMITSIAYTGSR